MIRCPTLFRFGSRSRVTVFSFDGFNETANTYCSTTPQMCLFEEDYWWRATKRYDNQLWENCDQGRSSWTWKGVKLSELICPPSEKVPYSRWTLNAIPNIPSLEGHFRNSPLEFSLKLSNDQEKFQDIARSRISSPICPRPRLLSRFRLGQWKILSLLVSTGSHTNAWSHKVTVSRLKKNKVSLYCHYLLSGWYHFFSILCLSGRNYHH